MANSNAPTGLTPVRYASGAPYNGAANVYFVPASDSTALYIGDPVIMPAPPTPMASRPAASPPRAAR
jgi:hypothetical protein